MKASKKILSLLLVLVMAFAMVIPAMADDPAPETPEAYAVPADVSGKIVILHTNDVHGGEENSNDDVGLIRYTKVVSLKKQFEDAGATVILVDAGDFSQNTLAVGADRGKNGFLVMNLAGYDVAAPGNHEFDYGVDNFMANRELAEFPILVANMEYEGDKKYDEFEDHVILTAGDKKIGVFGLDTAETQTKTHPAKIVGLKIHGADEMNKIAQAEVDTLKAENCDYIICLGHLGIDEETGNSKNRSIDLLNNVTGIDVFIDGHSHSTLEDIQAEEGVTDGKVGDTYLTSTGTGLANIGVVILDGENISVSNVPFDSITEEETEETAAIKKFVDEIRADLKVRYDSVKVGTTEVDLNGERDPGNRTEETNLGDLICDALLWRAEKEGIKADAAFTNGGGIRTTIKAGEITRRNTFNVLPFMNTLAVADMTGAQLLEILEASTYCTPKAVGGFPQVAGIEYTIDTTVVFDQGEQYPETTYFKPASIKRVSIQTVGGEPFDANKTYHIVTNDFLAAGGDTCYTLKTLDADHNKSLDVFMDEALESYVQEELKGTVTAEQYGKPQGRITIKASVADVFSDVETGSWFKDAVQYAYDNKFMIGTSDNTFAPNETLTNAETIQLLYNMEGNPTVENVLDSVKDKWYADAVSWAAAEGLISADNFTEADILRGEVNDLLTLYRENKGLGSESLFHGDENGNLNFDKALNRAEMAQLLLNASEAGK